MILYSKHDPRRQCWVLLEIISLHVTDVNIHIMFCTITYYTCYFYNADMTALRSPGALTWCNKMADLKGMSSVFRFVDFGQKCSMLQHLLVGQSNGLRYVKSNSEYRAICVSENFQIQFLTLESTAGAELFKYCNSRLHNGVCNCTTHYFALLSLTEHCWALLRIVLKCTTHYFALLSRTFATVSITEHCWAMLSSLM